MRTADWPARMQRLRDGTLSQGLAPESELWLDGGHNPSAGQAIAAAFAELHDQRQKPLVLILGMLNTKDAAAFVRPFKGLAQKIITIAIPGEANAFTAEGLGADRDRGRTGCGTCALDRVGGAEGERGPSCGEAAHLRFALPRRQCPCAAQKGNDALGSFWCCAGGEHRPPILTWPGDSNLVITGLDPVI